MPSNNSNQLEKDAGLNILFLKRLLNLCPILFPGVCSFPTVLFFILLLICFLEQYVVYNVGLISSQYYLVLGNKDYDGFISTTIYSVVLVIAISGVLSCKNYISSVLYISWRQVLSRALHRLYFSGITYYSVSIDSKHKLDNPDMRMTQDVELLTSTLGTISSTLIISPFKIGYYTYAAYAGTGWFGPTMCILFFLSSSLVNRLVMHPIVPCVVAAEKCEGNLRYKHMQIRSGCESVAFSFSEKVENKKTNFVLDELVTAKQVLFNKQFWLGLCQNLFNYLGSIISYLTIAVAIFSGVYDDVDPTTLSSIISKNAFVCIMLISSLGSLVNLCSQIVEVAGASHRVSQLLESLQALHSDWSLHIRESSTSVFNLSSSHDEILCREETLDLSAPDIQEESNADISQESYFPPSAEGAHHPAGFLLNEVTLVNPSGDVLVKNLTLSIVKGENLLIMGPSSCGKTSLLRALRGLWPVNEGSLLTNKYTGPKSVIFLPQKPFLTNGTLREQVIYPEQPEEALEVKVTKGNISVENGDVKSPLKDEEEIITTLLKKVDLEFLLSRCSGLDTDPQWQWSDVLSPGEVQRLCFLRLLFHRPQFAVLDEATSALSAEAEESLYSLCREAGITLVSVAHRETVKPYHQWLLRLSGGGAWNLNRL